MRQRFHTAMFGFKKEDVMEYIEEVSKRTQSYKSERDAALAERDALQAELDVLRHKHYDFNQAPDEMLGAGIDDDKSSSELGSNSPETYSDISERDEQALVLDSLNAAIAALKAESEANASEMELLKFRYSTLEAERETLKTAAMDSAAKLTGLQTECNAVKIERDVLDVKYNRLVSDITRIVNENSSEPHSLDAPSQPADINSASDNA